MRRQTLMQTTLSLSASSLRTCFQSFGVCVLSPPCCVTLMSSQSLLRATLTQQECAPYPCSVFIIFLMFPSCSTRTFGFFATEQFDADGENGLTVMRADRSIDTTSFVYRGFTIYASLMLLVWPFGVPWLYISMLWRHRHELRELRRIEVRTALESSLQRDWPVRIQLTRSHHERNSWHGRPIKHLPSWRPTGWTTPSKRRTSFARLKRPMMRRRSCTRSCARASRQWSNGLRLAMSCEHVYRLHAVHQTCAATAIDADGRIRPINGPCGSLVRNL